MGSMGGKRRTSFTTRVSKRKRNSSRAVSVTELQSDWINKSFALGSIGLSLVTALAQPHQL